MDGDLSSEQQCRHHQRSLEQVIVDRNESNDNDGLSNSAEDGHCCKCENCEHDVLIIPPTVIVSSGTDLSVNVSGPMVDNNRTSGQQYHSLASPSGILNLFSTWVSALSPVHFGRNRHSSSETSLNSGETQRSIRFCRICHDGETTEALIAPCQCTGSVALIHVSCLETWLTTANSNNCEICKFRYQTQRVPRAYSEYLQDSANQFNVRNLIADIICFFLLTPLLVLSTYLCIVGAQQYFSKERWEAVGLLFLSMFLLAVYFTWCHVTSRFHVSAWHIWQQTHQHVRVILSGEGEEGNRNSSSEHDMDNTNNNNMESRTAAAQSHRPSQEINMSYLGLNNNLHPPSLFRLATNVLTRPLSRTTAQDDLERLDFDSPVVSSHLNSNHIP